MTLAGPVAGVLLAAGLGQRMQRSSQSLPTTPPKPLPPKALVPLAEQPLCRHAAQALADADYALRVAVVPAGAVGAAVQAALAGLGFQFVTHAAPQRGLLSSFCAAVNAFPTELQGATFALADMPLVSRATHTALLQVGAQAKAAQCVYGEVFAPPVWLAASLFPALLALPDRDAGPRELLRGAKALPRPKRELLDVDTLAALARAERYLRDAALDSE